MAGRAAQVAASVVALGIALAAGAWALGEDSRPLPAAKPLGEPRVERRGPEERNPEGFPPPFTSPDILPAPTPAPGPVIVEVPVEPPAGPVPPRKPPHPTAITGTVVNHRGQVPAALGVFVTPGPQGGKLAYPAAAVARDGAFETGPLEPGSYTLSAWTNGLKCGDAVGIASGARNVRVVIQSRAEISGKVVDPDGNPAKEGILVVAEAMNQADRLPGTRSTAWTEADGSFKIQFLGEFEYQVYATQGTGSTPLAPFIGGWPEKGIRVGRGGVTVRLERPAKLSGTLLGPDGRPFGKGGIRAFQERNDGTRTGVVKEDGTFSIEGLLPGKARIQHHFPRKWKPVAEVNAPAEDLRLTVTPD
jgi:hypothetical protein